MSSLHQRREDETRITRRRMRLLDPPMNAVSRIRFRPEDRRRWDEGVSHHPSGEYS